jgi:NAD(P)-dependent dehydrogenase (short-subunit alcohol dehydrogenase family)
MERQGKGAIVNISLIASCCWTGITYLAYHVSKAAVDQLTQSIALEYAACGSRAVILLGFMDTPRNAIGLASVGAGGDVARMNSSGDSQSPTGKMSDAWDIAHAALYLASDEARYVDNGVQLLIDGGLTCKIV